MSEADYGVLVGQVVAGLTVDPAVLLEPLRRRMTALAEAERYEDAAVTRDRAQALARALHRQRRVDRLRRAGRVELELAPRDGSSRPPRRLVLDCGRLLDAADADHDALDLWPAEWDAGPEPGDRPDVPLARHLVDELACVASWLDAEAHRIRLVHCDGELASCLPPIPLLSPTPGEKAPSSDRRAPVSARRGPRP